MRALIIVRTVARRREGRIFGPGTYASHRQVFVRQPCCNNPSPRTPLDKRHSNREDAEKFNAMLVNSSHPNNDPGSLRGLTIQNA